MKAKLIIFISATLILVCFQNCSHKSSRQTTSLKSEENPELLSKANFEWLNNNLIRPKCVECHSSALAFGGYEFTSYEGVLEAMTPGDPEGSVFYIRSFSTTFFELSDEERSIIYIWIANGAK